jgi:hypothetical protein
MDNDNVLNLVEEMRRRDTARLLLEAKMTAREEGLRLLFPAVERMRQMGLPDAEIGRFFKFVGNAFLATEVAEGREPKPSV